MWPEPDPADAQRPGDPLAGVHAELRAAAQQLLALPPLALSDAALPALRAQGWPVPPPLAEPVPQRLRIPGLQDQPGVALVVVGPGAAVSGVEGAAADGASVASAGPADVRPVLLHVHGGGFVLGRADADLHRLQVLALALDALVVSVDYRLAPESPFPAAVLDLLAAVQWLRAQAPTLGADPQRIAVLGESAGGGLAAMLTLAMRARGLAPLCHQVLVYPMLDDRSGSSHPVLPPFGQLLWGAAHNRFGWSALLGQPAGLAQVPPDAVPARAESLQQLPPCFIGTGGLDLFLPENLAYAQRLMAAGVPTELVVVPGAFHGFDVIAPQAGISQQFTHHWQAALRRAWSCPSSAP